MAISDARDIIRQKPFLLWWVKDYDGLDNDSVVEAVLNHGDWEELQDVIKVIDRNSLFQCRGRAPDKSTVKR